VRREGRKGKDLKERVQGVKGSRGEGKRFKNWKKEKGKNKKTGGWRLKTEGKGQRGKLQFKIKNLKLTKRQRLFIPVSVIFWWFPEKGMHQCGAEKVRQYTGP
jgi:hypothetical protein